jgi:hypothetical protein
MLKGNPPSQDPAVHPIYRRFSPEIYAQIKASYIAKKNPRTLDRELTIQHPGIAIESRDIYNAYAQFRAEFLDGRTSTETLLDWLQGDGDGQEQMGSKSAN